MSRLHMSQVSTRALLLMSGTYYYVIAIAQASHYSGNPAAFKLFQTLLGHYVMTQMIFLGHIILQDKRAGIKAQVSTLASIMTTLLVTRNLSKPTLCIFVGFNIKQIQC